MITICAISDLHGTLPVLKPCDLVLICGDIVPLNIQSNSKRTYKWFKYTFKEWANNLPCDKVIFIAGNHELTFPNKYIAYKNLFPNNEKVTYLCNEEYIYKGSDNKEYKIFGCPYCSEFGNWAFMYPGEDLVNFYTKIPNDLDILITHDQPFKYGDILLQEDCPWAHGDHIGNPLLLSIIEVRKPRYQFNGHLHSCDHNKIMIGNTEHYNVSIKNESYDNVYEPLYLNITNG